MREIRRWLSILGMLVMILVPGNLAAAQCGDVSISGTTYSGTGTVTYTLDAVGEPIVHRDAVYAPAAPPLTPAANNAQVMIQEMETGAVVSYGTFPNPNDNFWTACLPAGSIYIAMFSATDHDLTSRVFDLTGDVVIYNSLLTDVYLPALHMDLDTGAIDKINNPLQPPGNLLVYAFEENEVNGDPDWPIDHSLPNVLIELYEPLSGTVVASGYTLPGLAGPGISTTDGLNFDPAEAQGHLYLENIPPGEYRLRATPPGHPGNTATALDGQGNPWTDGWYHSYTMEGTPEWEILIYPGDPGTEAGGAMAWFGFVKKLGQLGPDNPCSDIFGSPIDCGTSSISGVVEDADVAWENVVQPGVCIPGVNWNPNLCEAPEAGAPLDPAFINQGVTTNGPLAEAFLVLWQRVGDNFRVFATTETNAAGEFSIDNIPAGSYNIFFVDKKLENVFGKIEQLTVDGINSIALPVFANEQPGMPLVIVPRFGARVRGHVIDGATGIGINDATVNLRYQAGNAAFSTVTGYDPMYGDGWYNFDFLGEIETMAMIDVEMPAGFSYRGKLVTDTYYPDAAVPPDPDCTFFDNCPIVPDPCNPATDPACVIPGDPLLVERNGVTRWVQYYTANYQSNLILEPIPADVGQIQGLLFNDRLAIGSWLGDGIYDKVEEGVVQGATIELLDANGDIIPLRDLNGLPVIDPLTLLPVQDPATLTTSGAYDPAIAVAQGYIQPGISVPPDEWGGFFSGPMPGFYEFRDVAPGDYRVRLTLPNGFHASDEVLPLLGPTFVEYPLTVVAGARNDLDIGLHTLVPQAGQLEGGIFDDTFLDQRWYSAFSEEKQLLVGLGVVVRDYLGYQLDTLVQPSAVCYPGTTPYDPAQPQVPYGAICDRPDLGYGVEIDRLVAPGLHLYWGNDPSLPVCTTDNLNSPCFDPTLFNLELPYTMGQGLAKYEADWSLPVALATGTIPVASFTAIPNPAYINQLVTFDASASMGQILTYSWDFGDQTTGVGVNQNHSYALAGTYNVTLTVTNDLFVSATATQAITIIDPQAPVASFTVTPNPAAMNTLVALDATASQFNLPATGIVSYTWDFGDGTTATGMIASHSYSVARTYPVTLTVTDDQGLQGSATLNVGVFDPDCPDPGDVVVASLDTWAIVLANGMWSAEVTLNTRDLTCNLPFVLDLGDEVMYRFGTGEWKQEQADGANPFVVFTSAPLAGSIASITFDIDHVDPEGPATNLWNPDPALNVLHATIFAPPALPLAATELTAVQSGLSEVHLFWTDDATNETGFRIERALDAVFSLDLMTTLVGPNVVAQIDTSVIPGVTYFYRVVAFNGLGDALASNPVTLTIQVPTGDLNGDALVDIVDALQALQIAIGIIQPTPDELLRGDVAPLVNGEPAPDGRLGLADVLLTLRKALGLINF